MNITVLAKSIAWAYLKEVESDFMDIAIKNGWGHDDTWTALTDIERAGFLNSANVVRDLQRNFIKD